MALFAQRTAIISGGGTGIGRATALALAGQGAQVTIIGPDEEALQEVAAHSAGQITPQVCDVRDTTSWTSLITRHSDLDILINNAAISVPTDIFDPEDPSWQAVLSVNFQGALHGSRAAATIMRTRGGGRIVNVTSIHGGLCELKSTAYGVGKAALNQLTRCLAVELGSYGILVNAVAPGFVDTPMSRATGINELETDWFLDNFIANGRIPLRRAAQPEEIAQAVLFLASPANTYITGHVLTADGGLTQTL